MDKTAQTSAIVRRPKGTHCNRTLRSKPNPTAATLGRKPARQRRAWLAKVDKAADMNGRALLFWLETAARYHTDPAHDVIVALKTIEGPAGDETGLPALYVWEVAWRRERGEINWHFIVWDASSYGVRFLDCAGRDEAMALYHLPVEQGIAAVQRAPGIYLRADCRPR